MATADEWLAKLANLKVYRAKGGPAPHKPLLLLTLLELAEQGVLPKDVLPLSAALAFPFRTYWNIVAHRRTQRPDVRCRFTTSRATAFGRPSGKTASPHPTTA